MFDLLGFELTLTQTLESGIQRANERFTADRAVADITRRIDERLSRGEFLPGSTPGAERYKSSGHKKAREREGLQIGHVDLFFGGTYRDDDNPITRAPMLDGRGHRVSQQGDELLIEYGYLEGLATAEQIRLAGYHNETGAGRGRVIRKFVGLTDDESEQVIGDLGRDYGSTLGDVLG